MESCSQRTEHDILKINVIFIKALVAVGFSVLNFNSVPSNGDFEISAVTAF